MKARLLLFGVVILLVAAVVPVAGISVPGPAGAVLDAAPSASARTMGTGPFDAVLQAANDSAMCSGLTPERLAAMAFVPTFHETGAPADKAPSPMTLSRYDNSSSLYAFSTPGLADKAFFHPGIGMWQFDSAGGWPLSAAGAIDVARAAQVAIPLLRQRFCAATGSDAARRKSAWLPWLECQSGTLCEDYFASLFPNGVFSLTKDASVQATGGMEYRTCTIPNIGTVTCGFVDPAKAQGYKVFTQFQQGNGVSPLTAPFYVFEANGREYRYWLKADTGYSKTIEADKGITANARGGITWRYLDDLCDATARRGTCGVVSQPGTWTNSFLFGGWTFGEPGVGTNIDGRQELFVVGLDGALYHNWQNTPNGLWYGWVPLGGSFNSVKPAVGRFSDGRLAVFLRGTDNAIWTLAQQYPNGGWTAFRSLGGNLTDDPSLGVNADGRLEVFARAADGGIWHTFQSGTSSFSDWYSLGGQWPAGARIAIANNSDGRMELFGVATDGQIWHAWQVAPNQAWTIWWPLGGSWPQGRDVAAARNQDGRLEVFARGGDSRLYSIFQVVPNSGWSGFGAFDNNLWSSSPAVVRDATGRLNLAAILSNGYLAVRAQLAPNMSWNTVQVLGGNSGRQPILGINADTRLEAFNSNSDATISHAWQATAAS